MQNKTREPTQWLGKGIRGCSVSCGPLRRLELRAVDTCMWRARHNTELAAAPLSRAREEGKTKSSHSQSSRRVQAGNKPTACKRLPKCAPRGLERSPVVVGSLEAMKAEEQTTGHVEDENAPGKGWLQQGSQESRDSSRK
jgi:hypothetical protein